MTENNKITESTGKLGCPFNMQDECTKKCPWLSKINGKLLCDFTMGDDPLDD